MNDLIQSPLIKPDVPEDMKDRWQRGILFEEATT